MKLKSFLKIAILVLVLAGTGVSIWATGGFADYQVKWLTTSVGETIDIGPLTFTPLRAVAEKIDYFDSYPDETNIRIEGKCLNTTDKELEPYNVVDAGFLVTDPSLKNPDNTRVAADVLSLSVGGWGKHPVSEAFNPTDLPLKCQLNATFHSGYHTRDEVRLAMIPVEPLEGHYSTVSVASYGYRNDADPWHLIIPLTWESGD